MIILNQLSMIYAGKLLFNDVTMKLNSPRRYALVGANGAGKSTLMRIISGDEEPSMGSISMPKDITIGQLKQDQFRFEEVDIIDVVLNGKPKLWEAMVKKQELLDFDEWTDELGYQLGELEETIGHYNGYSAEALAQKLLIGLGIEQKYHRLPLKTLSGGYKLRVLLAKTLFSQPDLLLLDEPTNHLDILSIAWLERYLRNEFSGLLVFISHDMDFIDNLADSILDIDYGDVRSYTGNYEKFLTEKALVEEQKLKEKKSIEKKLADIQLFVDKFRAKASKAKQVQSRIKMIDKVEMPDIKNSSRISPHFLFKPYVESGKRVLKVKGLSKAFNEVAVFNNFTFNVQRGEKIAILGVNGAGKSTLLKILLEQIKPDAGEFEWGHAAQIAYFSQDHHEALNKSCSVVEWLTSEVTHCADTQTRKILGQVLFKKDDVHKDILTISGGEAARLLLARMMLTRANILVLDEPTNHLDIESTEALAAALAQYTGTLFVVSHNRHFVSKFADRILYIDDEKSLYDHRGHYAEFQELIESE